MPCVQVEVLSPECSEGEQKCIGNDLYECQGGTWVLIEQNSSVCIVECSEGETKCIGKDLYECQNGSWILVEPDSPSCAECNEGETRCIDNDLYVCRNGGWVIYQYNSSLCRGTDWEKYVLYALAGGSLVALAAVIAIMMIKR